MDLSGAAQESSGQHPETHEPPAEEQHCFEQIAGGCCATRPGCLSVVGFWWSPGVAVERSPKTGSRWPKSVTQRLRGQRFRAASPDWAWAPMRGQLGGLPGAGRRADPGGLSGRPWIGPFATPTMQDSRGLEPMGFSSCGKLAGGLPWRCGVFRRLGGDLPPTDAVLGGGAGGSIKLAWAAGGALLCSGRGAQGDSGSGTRRFKPGCRRLRVQALPYGLTGVHWCDQLAAGHGRGCVSGALPWPPAQLQGPYSWKAGSADVATGVGASIHLG